jgi:type VI secretion system protein ImpL
MHRFKLSKILKTTLVLALVVLCILLTWSLVLLVLGLDYQWWIKAMILTCLGASILIAVLLRKLWLKRREMKFVDGIIGTDDRLGSISAIGDASRELRRRFKEAITTLKKSDLKGKGNPLYVLPWYLMIGKSGAGKSTAIKSARLPSPFGDINRISGVEGTRNCDWWFFDDAVVIDIAGRYSVHRDAALDKSEWLAFLEHLTKYRKKEPINGVIVTVEADHLLEADPEKVEDEGRILRKRIDEVINMMGAKFPIYLLVTKCDLIFGMNRFCRLLSETSLEQAMGLMNHDGESDIAAFVNRTVDAMVDKLKDFRLILANKEEVRERHYIEPDVLVFPDEFARVRQGLISFCKGAFKDNPFQELPVVRGIYFCSGQQVGRPICSQAPNLANAGGQELPGTGNGFFLYDFFAKILPADRSMYAPTKRAREWHRLTHNLWLTGFATLVLIFCILLTHSWNENKAAINLVSPQYKQTLLFKNDPVSDIAVMADFGGEIRALEQRNQNWRFPRLGLFASVELEKKLKQRYCQRFYEHFDADITARIEGQIADGGWQQDNWEPAVRYIPFLTRKLNIMKAKFEGADAEKLKTLPDPDYVILLEKRPGSMNSAAIAAGYKKAFINYLLWQDDVEPLNKSLAGMQHLLRDYFHENQGGLVWLAQWANQQTGNRAITLNSYWQGNSTDDGLASVEPAYTLKGRECISRFVLDELEKAVDQPLWIAKSKAQFVSWYKNTYFGQWTAFCKDFGKGLGLFKTKVERMAAMERLTGDDSPYLGLLKTLETELLPAQDNTWPSLALNGEVDKQPYEAWLAEVKGFGLVQQALAGDAVTGNKTVEKLANRVSFKGKTAARVALGALEESKLAEAKETYKAYRAALGDFGGITASAAQAYHVAREGFEDDPAQAKSPLLAAQRSLDKLHRSLGPNTAGDGSTGEDPFWPLLTQPVDILWKYSVAKAGCHLQRLWDEEVMVDTQRVYDRQRLVALLFGDKGSVDRFVQKNARPFLQLNSRRGYYPRDLRGSSIPFRPEYFRFVEQGKRWETESGGEIQSNYVVDMVAFPTDVNIDAKAKPYMTQLVVESSKGDMALVNRQYPIKEKFNWSPATCGDVTLQIMLGDITLTKKYTGYCAFGKFLSDFKSGKKIFTGVDFPEYAHEFYRMGVREIQVLYRFEPSQVNPIVRLLTSAPGRPPVNIISCPG